MDFIQNYKDSMDTTDDIAGCDPAEQNGDIQVSSLIPTVDTLRRRSLLLISYPWLTSLPMVESRLADQFMGPQKDHYTCVS
jgi:hypothetical protein